MEKHGKNYRFYAHSCLHMPECADNSIGLTVTSPPYWNAIDYDIHTAKGKDAWHRQRDYAAFGLTYEEWLDNIQACFSEVFRVTMEGGFCCIVIGTILHKRKHYPAPFDVTTRLMRAGWAFHQDIIWNKVTGGVKRAGSFIQHRKAGYYYPNIMTEYVLIFRKGEALRRGTGKALPIDELFKRDIANNIWHIAPVPPRSIEHPCPFPDELARRLVLLYSCEGDEVLDPFLGSGQTARAALHNARRAVGYDIEAEYVALAESRLQEAARRRFQLVARFDKIPAAVNCR